MPIRAEIEGGESLARLGNSIGRARALIAEGVVREGARFGLEAVGNAKRKYLSGPRPRSLGVVTGRLRSSIAHEVDRTSDKEVTVTVGTNVEYAAIHELGFNGMVQIPAFTRVVAKVFGRSVAPTTASVRAHSRRLHMPKRAFLQPSINDAYPAFENSIRRIMTELMWGDDLGSISQ